MNQSKPTESEHAAADHGNRLRQSGCSIVETGPGGSEVIKDSDAMWRIMAALAEHHDLTPDELVRAWMDGRWLDLGRKAYGLSGYVVDPG